ncbi:PilW family protein [Pseudohongiella acticola]|nr:type II secretion system protein [Pseudohongiella acticola]
MTQSCFSSRGFTLVELLMALGLGASLSAVTLQVFTDSVQLQLVHTGVLEVQQRSAYAQFLLRTAIRESASPCPTPSADLAVNPAHHLDVVAANEAAVNALPNTQVLRVRTGNCEEPAHLFYVGRRGNDSVNDTGLFRRVQRSDGSYRAAEELIAGVTAMSFVVGIAVTPTTSVSDADLALAYVEPRQVASWSRAFSVTVALSWPAASIATDTVAETADGLTMTFTTALRQVEVNRIFGGPV